MRRMRCRGCGRLLRGGGHVEWCAARVDNVNEDDGTFDNDKLSKALPLRHTDLVEQGVDFHCDNSLVPAVAMIVRRAEPDVVDTLLQIAQALRDADHAPAAAFGTQEEELGWLIKKCVWTFRSSVNNHRMWDGLCAGCQTDYEDVLRQELEGKKILSAAWRLLAAPVSQHCSARCRGFGHASKCCRLICAFLNGCAVGAERSDVSAAIHHGH